MKKESILNISVTLLIFLFLICNTLIEFEVILNSLESLVYLPPPIAIKKKNYNMFYFLLPSYLDPCL